MQDPSEVHGEGSVLRPQDAAVWLFQYPMMVFFAWWDLTLHPSHPWRRALKDCDQLPIPDPIEKEGEDALFA